MSSDELLGVLADAYRDVKGRPVELRSDLRLREDLDLDSLDAIDILSAIAEERGDDSFELTSDLDDIVTVGDLVELVQRTVH